MHRTVFSQSFLRLAISLLSCSILTPPALGVSEKNSNQSEIEAEGERKPARKKKPNQEKKPKLALLGSKITYSAPRRWTKPQISSRGKLEALQFVIPLPSSEDAARTTSAIVVAESNTDTLSLTDFSNSKLPRKYPAGTVVADQPDGDSWRTVISHVHEANPPYTVLDRFGVAAGVRVHFRIIFPKEDDAKAAWPQMLSQESNNFIRGLRINEKNKVTAELFYDNNNWGLREAKVGKKSVAKEPSRDAQKAKSLTTKKAVSKSSPKVEEEFSP